MKDKNKNNAPENVDIKILLETLIRCKSENEKHKARIKQLEAAIDEAHKVISLLESQNTLLKSQIEDYKFAMEQERLATEKWRKQARSMIESIKEEKKKSFLLGLGVGAGGAVATGIVAKSF